MRFGAVHPSAQPLAFLFGASCPLDQLPERIRTRKLHIPEVELQLRARLGREARLGIYKKFALRGVKGKLGIRGQLGKPAVLLLLLAHHARNLCKGSRITAGQLVPVRLCLSEGPEVTLNPCQLVLELSKLLLYFFDRLLRS